MHRFDIPLDRRMFLLLAGGAGLSALLPGCAARSLPINAGLFPALEDQTDPALGLATSLRTEYDYMAQVEGALPEGLMGTLYRNGPGLFDRGGMRKRSIFDGDGMVQSFRFGPDGVRYMNRFVRTPKFIEESRAGRFIYPTFSTEAPGGVLDNLLQFRDIRSQAGVTVYHVNGRLYAFDESNLPFELDPDTLETIGPATFGFPEKEARFGAHSKLDRRESEWIHSALHFGRHLDLHVMAFTLSGKLKHKRRYRLPRYVYMHDFFVSDRHIMFNMHPMEVGAANVILGTQSLSESFRWRPEYGSLLMVIEREGEGRPVFIETDAFFMWHSANAYERNGEIVADLVSYRDPSHMLGSGSISYTIMHGNRAPVGSKGEIRRLVINPSSGTLREETPSPADDGSGYEWPQVNPLHLCHEHRMAYFGKSSPDDFFWSGVCGVDMDRGKEDSFFFGEAMYSSEPIFVPAPGAPYDRAAAKEPGWLMTVVYDGKVKKSFLAVLMADRVSEGPIALIRLRHHTPFSFHGFWAPA